MLDAASDDRRGPSAGTSPRDLAPRRQERIRRLVELRRAARLDELSSELGVSQATVRRDLDELAAAGSVRRVHGGAVAVEGAHPEPLFDAKALEAADEKGRIAARAVELLDPADAVYLDSGSTVLAASRLLHGQERMTVVTNSLPVANELAGRGPRLILVGGEVRAMSRALVGPLTRLVLGELRVDRALMGTYAFSVEDGLTTTDPNEAYTKELVLRRAREVILLADSRKVGTRAFVGAGRWRDIDVLVTDDGLDERVGRTLERRGVRVIRA